MPNSNQRKIGAILSYVSIVASTFVQLLYTPFLIRQLGQSEYGLYSLVSSIIGYLTVLDLGFGNAIVVHTAKYRATGDTKKEQVLHGMFRRIYIIIGLVAGLLGLIFALSSGVIFGSTMSTEELETLKINLLILSFNLFITFAFNIYTSIITASEKFIFQKTLAIINTVAKPLLMIPVLFLGYKSIALCLVITAVNIAVLLISRYYCRNKIGTKIKFCGFDKVLFKTILAYSFWIFLTQIVDKVNWSVDQFILGAVSGTIAVSVYSAAATLNTMFINLSTAISSVMLPKMAKMVANKASAKELSDEFVKIGRLQFLVIFLAVTGLAMVGREFIRLWLGEGFDEAYVVALLLVSPAVLSLIQNTGLSIMQAMDKFKFKAVATFVMAIINIIISIILANLYGATGAAIGTTISIILSNIIVMNIYYKKVIKLDIFRFWKNIVVMLLKFIPAIAITVAIMIFTQLGGIKAMLVYGGTYVVLYVLSAYFFVMNRYEKNLINVFVKKLTRKAK